jgi:hypothetical protein
MHFDCPYLSLFVFQKLSPSVVPILYPCLLFTSLVFLGDPFQIKLLSNRKQTPCSLQKLCFVHVTLGVLRDFVASLQE